MDPSAADSRDSRMRALVSGYVQGVGYRWYARQYALVLGLAGYARNLRDGRVEVVAEGPREALERYFDALRRGPEGGDVADVAVTWGAAEHDLSGFAIWRE
jgi:acylphosphatase